MAKILIYTLVFSPDQVSNAYVLMNLARELQKMGHEIKILTTTPHYQPPNESEQQLLFRYIGSWIFKSDFEGIPCYHIKVPKTKGKLLKRIYTTCLFHLRSLWFGKRNELECDIVLTITPPLTMGIIGHKLAKFHNAKSIFVVTDLLSDNLNSNIKELFCIPIVRWIESYAFHKNDAIVAVTNSSVKLIGEKFHQNKILKEISDSVDTNIYRLLPRNNIFSNTHNWNDKFIVSYIGNIGKYQDFSLFPDVVKKCVDIPIKFIIAGGGLKYTELNRQASELKSPHWEVWEYQPISLTPIMNASSDLCLVLLSPCVTKGSFPSKLYTIMACGRPVLFYGHCDTDIGRLIRENKIGWTVETGDIEGFVQVIHDAYENRYLLEDMGKNALALAQNKYSALVVAKQYHELIEKLLKSENDK
jgi:glycosyltransferase involved in cell wall biosynthesis